MFVVEGVVVSITHFSTQVVLHHLAVVEAQVLLAVVAILAKD